MSSREQGANRFGAVTESFDRVLVAAKVGDHEALSSLYLNHARMVYGYLRACGTRDPEDLTSEVFLGMLRGLARFDGDHPDFKRWLMTIAHRRLVDERRRSAARSADLADPVALEEIGQYRRPNGLRAIELDSELVSAFCCLTEAQQEVLALRFIADISLRDVAAITGRPTGAVKSLQNRGLESLRRNLPALRIQQGA